MQTRPPVRVVGGRVRSVARGVAGAALALVGLWAALVIERARDAGPPVVVLPSPRTPVEDPVPVRAAR